MDCDVCREAMSAALDGAADAAEHAGIDAHLDGCAACRAWQHDATRVTRHVRTAALGTAPSLVGLAGRVVDAAPGPGVRWRGVSARAGLAAVGVAQVVLGLVSLLGAATHTHAMTDPLMVLGAGMAHATHESAAWNLALGVSFLIGALFTRHLAGLLPVLGVFIAALAVLSGLDLVAGRVEPGRVVSHLVLVAGFLLGLVVVRSGPRPGTGPAGGVLGSGALGTGARGRGARGATARGGSALSSGARGATAPGATARGGSAPGWRRDAPAHAERESDAA